MLGGFVWALYMKTQWEGSIELGVDWSWGSISEVRGRKGKKEDAQQTQACYSEGEGASNWVWPGEAKNSLGVAMAAVYRGRS